MTAAQRAIVVAVCLALAGMAAAGEKKDKKYSYLHFSVIRAGKKVPIRNASVVLHPVSKDGKQEKGGLELKTDQEGKTEIEGIRYGKLRVQVVAQGFQTYGEDFEIDQPDREFVIELKRPQEQVTIYK
jgi:small ligand-binding sensory domain FIST